MGTFTFVINICYLVELMDAADSLQVLVVLCCSWAADVSRAFSPGDTGFVDGEDHPVYYTQGKELSYGALAAHLITVSDWTQLTEPDQVRLI